MDTNITNPETTSSAPIASSAQPNSNLPVPPIQQGNNFKKLQSLISIVVFVLFVASLAVGAYSGYTQGQAKATYDNVLNINKALKYYYADQDLYPSAEQFNNQKILVPYYLRAMPGAVANGGECAKYNEFQYSQSNSKKYSLQFCLNKAVDGVPAGIHTITEQGLQ